MPKKPASPRAYEHANLSCGLVSVQVSVYSGTDSSHGIKRNTFTTVTKDDDTTEDHPVGYGNIDKQTGELVPPGQPVVKKIATEYGHVFVEDHEIEKLLEITPRSIEIKEFQPIHLFYQGFYVPKKLYFVEAAKLKVGSKKVDNKAGQETLAVIFAAMKTQNAMALVEFTTRGVPKYAALLPNGTMWELHYTEELREQRPLPDIDIPTDVAKQAWNQYFAPLWSEEPVDCEDKRTALIQAFADDKAKAGDFSQPEAPEEAETSAPAAGSLLAMLSASVEQAKASAS